MGGKYFLHLKSVYSDKTFGRKINYFRFNFGSYIERLKTKRGVSVLEIGPGMGEFVAYLNSMGINNIDIVDNDKEILRFIEKRYKINKSFSVSRVKDLGKNLRFYDLIVLIQVLEHLEIDEYEVFIKTIYSKLKKGGVIIIVVPNANNPLGLVERYGDLQHKNSFTEQSLKDLVFQSNIKNYHLEIRGYNIPPYDIINIFRILFQKILHFFLLILMIANGGTFYKIMTPNIVLIIRKLS